MRLSPGLTFSSWWSRNRTSFIRLTLATIVPNLPLILIRVALHMKFGWFNLDYFFLTLLACEFSPLLATVLFLATYSLELVRLLDALFYFSQSDPLFAVRFLDHVQKTLVLGWAAAFALVCGLSLLLWRTAMPRRRDGHVWQAALPVGLLLLTLCVVDQANGYRLFGANRHMRSGYRATDEVLLRVPLSVAHPAPVAPIAAASDSASGPLWQTRDITRQHQDVLVVVVESMGRLLDEEGRAKEFALFQDPDIQRRYRLREGIVPFTGSTVSGEMRELCRLQTGMYITAATLAGHQPCLPSQYRDAGYETLAFHGFRSTMFQRSVWYPLLGFSGERFLGDMPQLPTCSGAFYGVCDADVAGLLRDRLESHAAGSTRPQFLYWMTLNSHLPVNEQHAPNEPCPVLADRHVCAQLAYVHTVLASVKAIALDPKIGRTAIVVVGDHAPPFLPPDERSRFDGKNVPFLYLEPR